MSPGGAEHNKPVEAAAPDAIVNSSCTDLFHKDVP